MNLVLFTHPDFVGSRSQGQFAHMLAEAYRARGHAVALRRPQPVVRRRVREGWGAKWAGYVDQYCLYPPRLRHELRDDPAHTLYVFCDQALGPWVPLVAHRPHVVHCHDLIALRSALGEFEAHPTGWSGRLYQGYIRHGFRRARHFISISQQSRADLHRLGEVEPVTSEVVYNGLHHPFAPVEPRLARTRLEGLGLAEDVDGFLLHVGGGQWYKNARGVIALYKRHVRERARPHALVMVSPPPDAALRGALAEVAPPGRVHFVSGVETAALQALYSLADALLFPSLAEGFGWPIAEAMACGCPVITTGAAPMSEVGGAAATYLPVPPDNNDLEAWADRCTPLLEAVLARPPHERARRREEGLRQAARFRTQPAIDAYLAVYERVLAYETGHRPRP